jgi:hypothetical protein
MKRTGVVLLITGFAINVLSSCTPTDEVFYASAHVQSSFHLTGPSAIQGTLSIDEAYLKLSHIETTGFRQGKNNTTLTHQVPADEPPYRLSKTDSNQVNFTLPFRSYDQLHFDLFLFQDTYEPIVTDSTPVAETPAEEEPKGNGGTNGGGDNGGDDEDSDNNGQDGGSEGDDDNSDGDEAGDHSGENDGDSDQEDSDDDGSSDDNSDDDEDNEGEDDDDGTDDDNDDSGEDDEDGNKHKDDKHKKDKHKNKGKGKKDKNKGKHSNDEDDHGGRVAEHKGQFVDIDHFFQHAKPGLVIAGTYLGNGITLKLLFVVDDVSNIRLMAKQNDSPGITLQNRNQAQVSFNPQKLFESITASQLESSAIQTYQGQTIIFIHRDFNTPLFDALITNLEGSADLNFSALPDEPGI